MSLRIRLIVAFFFFSVVPLAAVTFYSYTSNLRALQIAAQHQTEMLTGELTQRMQVVTKQISERVEHLMDVPAAAPTPAATGTSGQTASSPRNVAARSTPASRPATTAPAAPSAPSIPSLVSAQAVIDQRAVEAQVADALGEVAMLLNNVEVRGLGRGAPPATAAGRGAGRQGTISGTPLAIAPGTVVLGATVPAQPPSRTWTLQRPGGRGRPEDGRGGQGFRWSDMPPGGRDGGRRDSRGGPLDGARSGEPREAAGAAPDGVPAAGARDEAADPTHMKVDLAPIRRELFRQMAPDGSFEQMTPEERQRVGREVNQRLLGIVQGIQLSAAEVQKRVAEQQQAALSILAEKKSAPPAGAVPALPSPPETSPIGAPPPAAPAPPAVAAPRQAIPSPGLGSTSARAPASAPAPATAPATAPAPAPAPALAPAPAPAPAPRAPIPPMTRKAALTGTKLAVRLERDGELVQQVNAEINLPNLLATVFANTRRDSGEIPFAIGRDGHLYAPTEADRAKLASLDIAHLSSTPGTTRMHEWIVVTMPDQSGAGLRFGIARPVGDLLDSLRRTTVRNAGFGLLFIAIALGGIVPLSSRLTRNLSSLTDGVGRIARGDYGARVPVKSNDEIGRLASAFNRMAADVEQHQLAAVEQERIRRELELGRRIQSEMLPHSPLHFGLTEVQGVSMPAREVGGDFFNYFQLDSGQVALLVGDVSGKGVGAALLMANIQASLRTRFALGQELSAIAEAIDRDIEANSPGPVYATLFIAIFDPATRGLRYVNAGHNPQFVLRPGGRLDKLPSTGLPVGMLAGHGYGEREIQLAAGDLLFFYTDGCVEMEDEAGEMFGTERLESLVAAASHGSADDVLASVEREIAAFRGRRDLFDDATMMAVKVG